MSKRTILSIIIASMCVMNVFSPFVADAPVSYFDIFQESIFDEHLSTFWKVVFISPTGILAILTILHIAEPKSDAITRNHLAIAAITGFVLYLLLLLIMLSLGNFAVGVGDLLGSILTGSNKQSAGVSISHLGWQSVLYPGLFLSYVLVHRFMRYDTPEAPPTVFAEQEEDASDDYV